MRTEIDLDAAAQKGVIDEHLAITLRNFQADLDATPAPTSEKFVLFGGYADLVTGLGLALVFGASALLIGTQELGLLIPFVALGAYLIARQINMRASPAVATVVMIAFLTAASFAPFGILQTLFDAAGVRPHHLPFETKWIASAIMFACGLPAVMHFWRRFRFPPTLGFAVMATALFVMQIAQDPWAAGGFDLSMAVAIFSALGGLAWAIWWDMTDIRRETERSQTAFWLHCAAGFLANRALFAMLTGRAVMDGDLILTGIELSQLPLVLVMIAGAALISLLLDRRSLLVGVLLPMVGIFSNVGDSEIGAAAGMALAGSGLLFFSWIWVRARVILLDMLPAALAAQLPRTEVVQVGQRPTRRHLPLWPSRHDAR